MEDVLIRKVCPLPCELSEIKKNIPCPEVGCNSMFLNSSNLDMHLTKHHKKTNGELLKKDNQIKYQYHCPVDKCTYNTKSDRFFTNVKYLKQHYLKVHADKNYQCDKCRKGFSTEAAQKKHSRICGMKFACSCNFSYDSYEALLTHAKRHQHTFPEKYRISGKTSSYLADDSNCSQDVQAAAAITVPVHLLAVVALSELSGRCLGTVTDKGVQTDKVVDNRRNRKVPLSSKALKRKTSTETQTAIYRNPKISAETQTIGDYILKKAMKAADIPVMQKDLSSADDLNMTKTARKRRKSMETQTQNTHNALDKLGVTESQTETVNSNENNNQLINSHENKCLTEIENTINFLPLSNYAPVSTFNNNNPFNLGIDVGLPDFWQKNTSSTQTDLDQIIEQNINVTSVRQTDLSSLFESQPYLASGDNVSSTSQPIESLQRYFEDTSNSSFGIVNHPEQFSSQLNNTLCNEEIDNLAPIVDESDYASSNIENIITQTVKLLEEQRSCSIETQTEMDLNSFFSDDDDVSLTHYLNIETQTTEEVTLDHLLYSNSFTQTNSETLFSEFADIQTQTAWPLYNDDTLAVSCETQTHLSGSSISPVTTYKHWPITNKDTSYNDSQSNEFKDFIVELVKRDTNDKLL